MFVGQREQVQSAAVASLPRRRMWVHPFAFVHKQQGAEDGKRVH
jgi:hypothetical protein